MNHLEEIRKNKKYVITFTGGLGAQLISAAGYFYLKSLNIEVYADFSYFNKKPHLAKLGNKGDVTHYAWELDDLGLSKNDFIQHKYSRLNFKPLRNLFTPTKSRLNKLKDINCIEDGEKKIKYGFLGLSNPHIRVKIKVSGEAVSFKKENFGSKPFICAHIRRGDYLNVASYLVPDDDFIVAIESVSKLIKNLLIVSDTPISKDFKSKIVSLNLNYIELISGKPSLAHSLMRLSNILICSNSQFSLTASVLRPQNLLTIYPSMHDAGGNKSPSNIFLSRIRKFQLITGFNF